MSAPPTAQDVVLAALAAKGAPDGVDGGVWLACAREALAELSEYPVEVLAIFTVGRVQLKVAEATAEAKAEAERAAREEAEAERVAREEAEAAREEGDAKARAHVAFLMGKIPDFPHFAELIEWVRLVRAFQVSERGGEAGSPPRTTRASVQVGSHQKDSAPSSSSMSAVSRMNGFQLTRRHAYTWSLWELDYATAFESLLGEAGVNTVEARAAVEAWRECARLVHDFWRDISEVKQVQPLFYAWLSCVLRRVFDGTAEQVSTEQSLHVEVPVYTNEAWAQLPRDGATADDEKDKHVPRCGKVDVAVSAAGGSETVVVIELKAPSDPKWEGGRRCAAKGQVIVEAAAALAARSADACGETPMFGILTDMRFRLNALAFYPASPCTWVRQGGDDHENEDTDGYPPWTFAMTETSTAVDGNSSESAAAGSSADNAAEAWDGARAKRSGMVALVVLGLALCPDWDADGARNRVAGVVAGEVEKFVEKTEAVLSLSETPDLDGSGLGDDESSRDGSGGGGAADGDASDADGASGGAPDSERGSSKGRGGRSGSKQSESKSSDNPSEARVYVDQYALRNIPLALPLADRVAAWAKLACAAPSPTPRPPRLPLGILPVNIPQPP